MYCSFILWIIFFFIRSRSREGRFISAIYYCLLLFRVVYGYFPFMSRNLHLIYLEVYTPLVFLTVRGMEQRVLEYMAPGVRGVNMLQILA
jgi:hypothetical protein